MNSWRTRTMFGSSLYPRAQPRLLCSGFGPGPACGGNSGSRTDREPGEFVSNDCGCSGLSSKRSLTEAHGKWRYTDAYITNDKGHHGHRTPTWWVTGSTLTLFVNTSGLFILCGNKIYKGFPPKWSGRCGLGYLAPSLTSYPTLNASWITNLGSFRHKVAPSRRIQPDIVGKPLMYRNTDSVRTLFPSLKTSDLEEAILNISKVMEQGFTGTPQTLKAHPSGVSSFASVL
ncbi:endogenous retroviral envelope protein HEMO [Mesoplodon densirostris]|uniref:endogenous retroviral envelope protein HEMO n=1 Tax=Mesoplodon densirostris TaxID=48708 RepID=UPI0028DC133F|nr:endogenous retroviral envelope protein HEMO [Mesoplodon densirostris]